MKVTNRTITAQDVIDLDSCYEDEQVKALVPRPTTLLELCDLDIPDADKLWAITRLIESKRERVGLSCAFVRATCWDLLTDERSKNALSVGEKYARGVADDSVMATACLAASAASAACLAACLAASARAAASAASAATAASAAACRDAASAACLAASAATAASAAANARAKMVDIIKESLK